MPVQVRLEPAVASNLPDGESLASGVDSSLVMPNDAQPKRGWLERRRDKRRERRQRKSLKANDQQGEASSPEPTMLERAGHHRRTGRWEWLSED